MTSDPHFGHDKLAILRGYSSAADFEEQYIKAYNSAIQKHNAVVFLGDVCMSRESLGIISKLNGSKHLVLGNHDQFTHQEYLDAGFKSISAMLFSSSLGVVLTHYPVHPSYFDFRQKDWVNLHGHLHTKILSGQYVNCCVEQSLQPRSVARLKQYYRLLASQALSSGDYL